MNIQTLVGCHSVKGDVGIEIELEADDIPPASYTELYWRKEADASLRGESAEYVMRTPAAIEDLDTIFSELTRAFSVFGTKPRPTYRAGIHVHVNVQDLTPRQLITFMSAYFLVEEILLSYCDKSRKGNHFCLRMKDASYLLDPLVRFIETQEIGVLNTDDLRYSSLNVTSLFKYGSIEFRSLESTLDFERIKVWAGVLTHLRDYAVTLNSPVDLLGQASEMGFAQFAPIILGPWYENFKPWATEENIHQGVRNIQYAIYSRNWDSKNLNIFQNKNIFH